MGMEMHYTQRSSLGRDGRGMDTTLLVVLLLLVGVGLAVLFSASNHRATSLYSDPFHFFRYQLVLTMIGVAAATVAAYMPRSLLSKLIPVGLVVSLVLVLLTFVPGIGPEIQGARRWIVLFGRSFQPSELVKLTLPLYLAFILSKKKESLHDPLNSLVPPLVVVGVFVGLIYLQNDFSTAAFIALVSLAMFFVAGVPVRYFISVGVMSIPLALIMLFTREHRVQRIMAYLQPERDPQGVGYQILASQRALSDGGLWGSGMGLGVRKAGGLPEAHSDFVAAVIGEELGFFGLVGVVLLFAAFAWRGFAVAVDSKDGFSSLLAFGLTFSIVAQGMLNLAVVSGLVPATGIPLPFFSTGGSLILVTMMMCGLLLNASRNTGDLDG